MLHQEIIKEDAETIAKLPLDWVKLKGGSILITGASGLIGSFLVRALLAVNRMHGLEMRVVGLVRSTERAQKVFSENELSFLELVEQDVCNIRIDNIREVDYVIHAASNASPKYYGVDPVGTIDANIIGTSALLELARRWSAKRFVFVSSAEIYGGNLSSENGWKESEIGAVNTLDVRSCYAESKRMGEALCVAWHHQFGIPAVIARVFHTYGPGIKLDDGRVFADFISSAVDSRPLEMNSDGSAIRAYSYISDSISQILYIMLLGKDGQAYNVGGSERCSVLELAEIISRNNSGNLSLPVVFKNNMAAGYLKSTVSVCYPDLGKVHALGWTQKTGIKEGFVRTIQYYRSLKNLRECHESI